MTATEYKFYTLHCDHDGCKARYRGLASPIPRAALRRQAAQDGWTHVHEYGMPRQNDQDYCPNHAGEHSKCTEGEDSHG